MRVRGGKWERCSVDDEVVQGGGKRETQRNLEIKGGKLLCVCGWR